MSRLMIFMVAVLIAAASLPAQTTCRPDLSALAAGGKQWTVVNRSVTAGDPARKAVKLNDRPDAGMAWANDCHFSTGVIEFDARGRDVAQKSFLGVAFNGTPAGACEVIYFRPFNFKGADADHHAHAVQYVSSPDFGWQKLRAEHPGVYESAIDPPVDGNAWFHAKVVVTAKTVNVFVNQASRPTLTVNRLTDRDSGLVGLFVGDASDGEFANFAVTPDAAPKKAH